MLKLSALLCNTVQDWASKIGSHWQDDEGQTMVEYVMLLVLVALAVFLLAPNIKSAILKAFSNTSSALA